MITTASPLALPMKQQRLPSLPLLFFFFFALLLPAHEASFFNSVDITWGDGRGKILNNGNLLQLSLDRTSGSGFRSKQEYLFGKIDMQIKVVPGNSAGTVTAYYLSSQGPAHDEIDFEFLGNSTGEPYTLHTNLFSQGKGNREQQFKLWFDPRQAFHNYTILWNPTNVIWYVDGTPIRVFKNVEARLGVAYPKKQPMRIYSSLWNAEGWATRGGLVKTDWSQAPFVASYRNFNPDACVSAGGGGSSPTCPATRWRWWGTTLDAAAVQKLREVRRNNMIYDYCRDTRRFPKGVPAECSLEL